MTEAHIQECLQQIAIQQPVFAGDLIDKSAKKELMNRGWIMFYEDDNMKIPGYPQGTGGYCITELGKRNLAPPVDER